MFTAKKSFFLIATFLSASSLLIGQKCGSEIKSLYNDLLSLQGTTNPMSSNKVIRWGHFDFNRNTYTQLSKELYDATMPLLKTLFSNALQTGLMAQYKQLILSNNEKIGYFLDKQHLQIMAYMQNTYGGGQPFKYDPSKGPLQAGGRSDLLASVGTYTNPQRQQLQMTRYSVLNGIIDAMIALDNEGQASNANYQKFCSAFKINLLEAIKVAVRHNLLEIEEKIGPSHLLDTGFLGKLKSITTSIMQLKGLLAK